MMKSISRPSIKKEAIVFLLFFLTTSLFIIGTSKAQNPFIPKYDAVKRSERCFTVTPEANNQFGAVWWADKVDFSNDTLFNFVVYMGSLDGNGADGLAFVMHQDPRDTITDPSQQVSIGGAGIWDLEAATGDDGGGLGFAMHNSRVGPNTIPGPHGPGDDPENHKIQKSVAVEFDTWNNNDVPDGNNGLDANLVNQPKSPYFGWDHTAVIYNGDLYGGQQIITDGQGNTGRILPLKPAYAFGAANNLDGTPHHNLEDDRCYTFQVRWDVLPDGTQNLELWAGIYNGTTNTDDLFMIMTHNDDMINNVFGGDPVMRFGFTGSTGGAKNEQTICLLGENSAPFAQDDVASVPMNSTAVVDVESNDNDPDGDELHVPIIIDAANHGLATIFDSLNINYMRYTPNTNYVGLDTIGYITCDVNSTKCYAKCDTAYVYINVGCAPFDLEAIQISPNTVCSDSVPSNGSASALAYLNRTIWNEGFEDLPSNTTVDNGTSAWSFTKAGNCNNNGDIIRVDTDKGSKKFRVQNSGCEVEWRTEEIDISPYQAGGVDVTLNVKSKGKMENSDHLKIYYQLDGGPLVEFNNGIHIAKIDGTQVAYIDDIKGDKLQIVIRVINDSGNEEYFWDNIDVKALAPTVIGVAFNWYEGAIPGAASIYTGPIANGITDGVYTVIATDQVTGCLSNPVNVTIDSAGLHLQGGFIDQLAPYTNCAIDDGELAAGVMDGANKVTAGYGFEWYYQEDPKISAFIRHTGFAFPNLESREYSVIITEQATGCDTTINEEVINEVISPVLTANKLADVISCSDPNTGSGEASVGGSTNGYNFEWYIGPAIGAGSPDFTIPTVSTFPVGIYTVQAIDTGTSCASESRTITILDQSVIHDILVDVISEQISCDPLAPTGQLSGTVNEGGTPTTSGYTFNWYKGPNDILPARAGYTGGPVVDGLEAGAYRLVVIADATNCESYRDALIQDNIVMPADITQASSNVTSCAAPNGTISISPQGDPDDYTYKLYTGFGVIADSLISSSVQPIWSEDFSDLKIHDIEDNGSTAWTWETPNDSSKVQFVGVGVGNDDPEADPHLEFHETRGNLVNWSSEVIDIATYANVSVSLDVYASKKMNQKLAEAPDPTKPRFIKVYYKIDGGVKTLFFNGSHDEVEIPAPITLSLTGVNASSIEILIEVSNGGGAERYFIDNILVDGSMPPDPTIDGVMYTDLPLGNYTAIAIDKTTTCPTNSTTVTINDATVLPTASFTSVDQVSCDPTNLSGQLTAVLGIGALADYTFEWFENDLSGAAIAPSSVDGEVISSLDSGNYALRITADVTQCTNVYYPSVNLGIVLPVEVVSAVPSTNCGTTANGQLLATVDGGLTEADGYTFIWESVDNADTLAATTATVTSLEPGDYMLTVINDATTCESNPAPITVDDHTVIPDPALIVADNSSCDVNNPNGEVQVNGINNEANPLTDYHYTWYDGNSSGSQLVAPSISYPNDPDSSRISGLSASTVALLITNSITTCSNEVLSIINDINIKPIIDVVTVNHADNCVAPYLSGASIVSVNGGMPVPAAYSFEWTNLDGGPMITSTGDNISDVDLTDETLPLGNYQVIAYNAYNCLSDIVTFTIDDNAVPPTFNLSGYNNISCDNTSPVGSLLATRPDASYTISTYEWFEDNTSGTLLSTTVPDDSILYNLDAGTYAVRITDAVTGCTDLAYASIQDTPSNKPIIQNISNIGLSSCVMPNGELGFKVMPFENEPPFNTSPRTYTFYVNGVSAHNLSSAGSDNINFTGLEGGDWNAWVVDEYTQCKSATIKETIVDAPEISIMPDVVMLPTSCVGIDGHLKMYAETATNDSISGGLGFNFDWFLGADGSQGAVPFTTSANKFSSDAINIATDYYFVEIEDIETGCKIDTSVFIPSITLPNFTNVSISPSDRCEPFGNGSVSTELTAFSAGLNYSDYNILLFEGSTFNTSWPANTDGLVHSVLTPAGGPLVMPNDLKPGVYTMVVKEDFGDCFNKPFPVIIDLDFTYPEFTIDVVADKSCDGAPLGTGQLEILSTSPAIPLGDFSFEWFIGASSVAIGAQTPAELFANNYNVVGEITANVPGQACIGDSLISLPKILDDITLVGLVTPNYNCAPKDGSIQIIDIEENGIGVGVPGNYKNFTVFDADLVAFAPGIGDGVAIPWGQLSPGDYYLQAENIITKCLTEIIPVSVDDLAQDPIISIALNNPDYGCNIGTATGELEAFATAGNQNSAEYQFTWYRGAIPGPVVSNVPVASNITANSSTQLYIVEVEDILGSSQGCVASKGYTLVHQPTTVNVLNAQMTMDPQTICVPNGSIVLNQINEDDGSGVVPTSPDYTGVYKAQLLDSNLKVINPGANKYAEFFPASGVFGAHDIPSGTYYVQASNITTGCDFGPLTQVIINDVSKEPMISAILDSPDFACGGGTPTGQLTPTAIGGSDADNVQANFTIDWFVKSSGAAVPGGPVASSLAPDVYTLQVVDMSGVDQGCIASRDYEITSARHDIAISGSAQDQTICIADGTAQVDAIVVNGGGIGLPNAGWKVLLLDENTSDITPGLPATGFASNPFTNISAGRYFVQAQDDLTKCYSNPYQLIVNDVSEIPVIDIDVTVPQYSLNPNPASWTGALQASVTELATGVPDPGGYVYSWHVGMDDALPSLSGVDNVSAIDEGHYTFIAVSNTSGCEARYTKHLPFQYLEPVFNTSSLPQTICAPNVGGIEVTDITLDSAPDLLSDYTFNWHHDVYASGDTPDAIIPGNDVRTAYDNINAGSYYIIAKENWWMIDSYPLKVEVIDSTTNPIISFDAAISNPSTSCNETAFADGALAVDIYEDYSNPYINGPYNYSYAWYEGDVLDPANAIADSTSGSISGLTSGAYSVVVMNLNNNCKSERTFTIENESIIPVIRASQFANTNCLLDIANGKASADIYNSTAMYDYAWYEGAKANGNPSYQGALWSDRPEGLYTVVAVDQRTGTCFSAPVTIQVEDESVNPTVLINELSPVTNCDPERSNGVLSAVTQDAIMGHTFEWYLNGDLHATGPIASNLGLFDYQLLVINDITQCETRMEGRPTEMLSVVPVPNVDILTDRTSCLAPDGMATASISGNVTNYIFRYYKKSEGDELSNFYEDYTIYDLDTTTYYVTAEERTTGCVSDSTEFAISNEVYFPEIDLLVKPSHCLEPSGSAKVIISDMTKEYKVTWYGENEYEEQLKEIDYIPVGTYRVEVEGTDGCFTSAEAEVTGDVMIFNGVSANNDGYNDFFKVVCLEYFTDNNVKIYSRGGILVYEQHFYDMHDETRRFQGVSNKGANIIGKELPIGTYYYVVDKNNGSKPKFGYLELAR